MPPAYRGKAVSTQSRALVLPYARKHGLRRGRRFSGLSTSPRTSCSTRHPSSSATSRSPKRCSAASRRASGSVSTPSPAPQRRGPGDHRGPPRHQRLRSHRAPGPQARLRARPRRPRRSRRDRLDLGGLRGRPDAGQGPSGARRGPGPQHAARPDAVQPGTSPQTTRTGSASAAAPGTTRRARAGCDWTACSTFPRRASGARARSWNARCSRSWPRGCAPNTPGASAAPATSGTCSVRRRAA